MTPATLLQDFERAVEELKAALASHPSSRLEKAGSIQYFEFCFELAWKTVRLFASHQGLAGVESPRAALRTAFAQGWIDNEPIWLEMLEARNRMSHTYSAEAALVVFSRLAAFLDAPSALADKLRAITSVI